MLGRTECCNSFCGADKKGARKKTGSPSANDRSIADFAVENDVQEFIEVQDGEFTAFCGDDSFFSPVTEDLGSCLSCHPGGESEGALGNADIHALLLTVGRQIDDGGCQPAGGI